MSVVEDGGTKYYRWTGHHCHFVEMDIHGTPSGMWRCVHSRYPYRCRHRTGERRVAFPWEARNLEGQICLDVAEVSS